MESIKVRQVRLSVMTVRLVNIPRRLDQVVVQVVPRERLVQVDQVVVTWLLRGTS